MNNNIQIHLVEFQPSNGGKLLRDEKHETNICVTAFFIFKSTFTGASQKSWKSWHWLTDRSSESHYQLCVSDRTQFILNLCLLEDIKGKDGLILR